MNPLPVDSNINAIYFPSSSNNKNKNANLTTKTVTSTSSLKSSFRSSSNYKKKKCNDDDDDSTSGCLLVSDDNHFLIEWIAYHYHVIKLRHLIITMDPNSMTSPSEILIRWENLIKIEFWDDESRYFIPSNYNYTGVEIHRQRQKDFNVECLRTFKAQHKSWVLLSDTDEFITIHPELVLSQSSSSPQQSTFAAGGASNKNTFPKIELPNSVHTFLQSLMIPTPELNIYTPCIPIYRRQYSAKEEDDIDNENSNKNKQKIEPLSVSDLSINHADFATFRWKYWGSNKVDFPIIKRGNSLNTTTNETSSCPLQYKAGPTKVIIDLSRLRVQDLYHPMIEGNPHKPLESICSTYYDMYNIEETGFMIHHFLGTKEQWSYRRNDQRGMGYRMARYQTINEHVGIHKATNNELLQPWLKGFIQSVGETEAIRLLNNVGKLDPLSPPAAEDNDHERENYITTTTTIYQVGDLVQTVFDINAEDLEWYWVQITAVLMSGTYYNVVFQFDCFEKLGVPADEIRLNGTAVN
eukprot:CAMPEP_0194198282 /NCGR_PEP_ID=MMETSP0154-20130528/77680_1 /TAXON_ID=1049557 /ORGANISM="Thalassiothrix antarctica, Strain L6-D1" /LENGTH=522 /DNA_ID=CAMNT_0038923055 /DNA_START=93 /DNA_END=1661 /DNA_ORIENTATION=+